MWISWQRHRRSQEIASSLGAELRELVSSLPRPWKYVPLFVATGALLFRRRPEVVFVQCPSIFLGCLTALLRPVLNFVLVADLHNEAVRPFLTDSALQRRILRWMWRQADLNLVTNRMLALAIEEAGATAFVLPDRVPRGLAGDERSAPPDSKESDHTVVFICTFQPDEPFQEVIAAASLLPRSVRIYITGKHQSVSDLPPIPVNVVLTGFLSSERYDQLLHDADVIMDLTAMADCLVCGAYEAVAVGKPLITSDTRALREYFSAGTLYTAHTREAIAAAIVLALERRAELTREMPVLREKLDDEWREQRGDLIGRLQRLRPHLNLALHV